MFWKTVDPLRCTAGLCYIMPLGARFLDNQPNQLTMQASERPRCDRHFEHSLANADGKMGESDREIDWRIPEIHSVAGFRCNHKSL